MSDRLQNIEHKPILRSSTEAHSKSEVEGTKITKKEPKATRDSYGEALLKVGEKRSDIVVLDAGKNIIKTTKEALNK